MDTKKMKSRKMMSKIQYDQLKDWEMHKNYIDVIHHPYMIKLNYKSKHWIPQVFALKSTPSNFKIPTLKKKKNLV